MIQILWKHILLLNHKLSRDRVIILHMARQLSCRGMCTIMTCVDPNKIKDNNKNYFLKILIISS